MGAAALAVALAGCSAASIADRMPAGVAESADTPARPAADTYQYPAVHDMPPARPDQPLTDEQQAQMEQQLEKVRDQQEGRPAVTVGKKAANPLKIHTPATDAAQATGGKANP